MSLAAVDVWDVGHVAGPAADHGGVPGGGGLPLIHEGHPVPAHPPPAVVSPGLQIVKVLRRVSQSRHQVSGPCRWDGIDTRRPGRFREDPAHQSAVLANSASLSRLCRLLL